MEAGALIQPATEEDFELFSSLRGRRHPEGTFIGEQGDSAIPCTRDWLAIPA